MKLINDVQIKKLRSNAITPTAGSAEAAGYDLYACMETDVTIPPHETATIGTGIALTPPVGHFGAVLARSGLARKKGLAPANKVGVCDFDYVGEYLIDLHNDTNYPQTISPNNRIAQVVFIPYAKVNFVEVNDLTPTERGANGFGSSGV